MPYTIVHCADVHLETTFTELRGGARRRAALAEALERIVDLALERDADALTVGGDLYEAERAGPQTARFLAEQFARFGRPVFVAPGNHDPYTPLAPLGSGDLPANVRVFSEASWIGVPLADDLTLYGFGHTPAEPGRPFHGVRFDRDGTRIVMVHGSDEERCPPNKRATAPFTVGEVVGSGATLLLTGHYHGGYVANAPDGRPALGYPGSPEPIKFGERGAHGALVVTVDGADLRIEPVELAKTRLIEAACDLTGAGNEPAVLTAVERCLSSFGRRDYVKLRLAGNPLDATRVDVRLIAERFGDALGALDVTDESIAYDYASVAREPTVRGRVVSDLLALAASADPERALDARRALRFSLAAFDGSEIVP